MFPGMEIDNVAGLGYGEMTVRLRKPALAAAVVLAASAAGSGDFQLRLPGKAPVCAKSADTCAAAQVAIRRGWLKWATPDAQTACVPSVGCFSAESNEIAGRR